MGPEPSLVGIAQLNIHVTTHDRTRVTPVSFQIVRSCHCLSRLCYRPLS